MFNTAVNCSRHTTVFIIRNVAVTRLNYSCCFDS